MEGDTSREQTSRQTNPQALDAEGDDHQEEESIYSFPKNVYILSSAGKPIFSWKGDQQQLSTLTGLIQAIVSVCEDNQDRIQSICAGRKRFVFLLKRGLYFCAVSSSGESEEFLRLQLEYLYHQILFILTSKVHDVISNNPRYDLRSLLGGMAGTLEALAAGDCGGAAADGSAVAAGLTAGGAVPAAALPAAARRRATRALARAREGGDGGGGGGPPVADHLVYAVLLAGRRLVALAQPAALPPLAASDLLLLAHLVATQGRALCGGGGQEAWTPVCLPRLQASGFLHAYIALMEGLAPDSLPHGEKSSGHDQQQEEDPFPVRDLYLLLLSTGNTTDHFQTLQACRHSIEKDLSGPEAYSLFKHLKDPSLSISFASQIREACSTLHFLYIWKPKPFHIRQYVVSDFHFSVNIEALQHRIFHSYQEILVHNHAQSSAELVLSDDDDEGSDIENDGGYSFVQQFGSLSAMKKFEHTLEENEEVLQFIRNDSLVHLGISTQDYEIFATFSGLEDFETAMEKCKKIHEELCSAGSNIHTSFTNTSPSSPDSPELFVKDIHTWQ